MRSLLALLAGSALLYSSSGGKLADPPDARPPMAIGISTPAPDAPPVVTPTPAPAPAPAPTSQADQIAIGKAIGDAIADRLMRQNQAMLDQMSVTFAEVARMKSQTRGPCDGTDCRYAVGLQQATARLKALESIPKLKEPPYRFAGRDSTGQWYYDDDIGVVKATVDRKDGRSTGAPVARTYTVAAPAVTYAPAPVSYAIQAPMQTPMSYGGGFGGGFLGGGASSCGPAGCR